MITPQLSMDALSHSRRSSTSASRHETGSNSRAVQLLAQNILQLAGEQAQALQTEKSWLQTGSQMAATQKSRDEARQQVVEQRTRESRERAIEREQLEERIRSEEARIALDRVYEQQRAATEARARATNEANRRRSEEAARREEMAARRQQQKDANWEASQRKLRAQELEQQLAAERVQAARQARIEAAAGSSGRKGLQRATMLQRTRRMHAEQHRQRELEAEEREAAATQRLGEQAAAKQLATEEKAREHERRREVNLTRAAEERAEELRRKSAKLEAMRSASEARLRSARDELRRVNSEQRETWRGKTVAAFASREHGYIARAERGAGRRAAQEAQAALWLETKQRRKEETAARVAAEARAKRAMRAVEQEILVQSSFDRESVRRRIMEQLEASQHLNEKEKTQEVTVNLDMGAEFSGGVTEVVRRTKLPSHSEAARAAKMAEITARRAEAAAEAERKARARALITKALSGWASVETQEHALGGLRLGRSMFYRQGEAKQGGEEPEATVVEFGFDASKGRWSKMRRAAGKLAHEGDEGDGAAAAEGGEEEARGAAGGGRQASLR